MSTLPRIEYVTAPARPVKTSDIRLVPCAWCCVIPTTPNHLPLPLGFALLSLQYVAGFLDPDARSTQ